MTGEFVWWECRGGLGWRRLRGGTIDVIVWRVVLEVVAVVVVVVVVGETHCDCDCDRDCAVADGHCFVIQQDHHHQTTQKQRQHNPPDDSNSPDEQRAADSSDIHLGNHLHLLHRLHLSIPTCLHVSQGDLAVGWGVDGGGSLLGSHCRRDAGGTRLGRGLG